MQKKQKPEVHSAAAAPFPVAVTRQPMSAIHVLAEYLSEDELAEELDTTKRTLSRWRANRTGPPYVVIGRRIMYRRRATVDWLLSRERNFEQRKSARPQRAASR